jgi:serine/threonine protein kinase/formylglycine-generating enzyme required for sulfatase activity
MNQPQDDAHRRSDDADQASAPLQTFGHYQLVKELGRGAQGVVYLAEDVKLHRKVALKMLATARAQDADVRERFQREAELASKLEHPGICGVHEFGEVEGIPFIAMQFIPGVALSDMITQARERSGITESGSTSSRSQSGTSLTGKDSMQDILLIVENTARALHAAHEVGLLHRDIKPANIMIAADGHPVILDFGLARDMGDQGHTLTESGQALGTPAYMSAEQILGQRDAVDQRTDVYALGVTLYECLTLHRPFEADGFERLYHEILQGAPIGPRKHNPRIPQDLGTVVEVAMDRHQERRYASALEFAEDLRRVRSFEPIHAKAANLLTRTHKWVRRKPAPAVTIAAGLLFVLSGSGVLVQRDLSAHRSFERGIEDTETALAAQDPITALESLARARELRPESPRVFELNADIEALRSELDREQRREEALNAAKRAREESVAHQRVYADQRAQLDLLEEELEAGRAELFADYAPPTARALFAQREDDLRHLAVEAEKLLLDAREALERAARFEAPWGITDETRNAFASFFLSRWREAVDGADLERADLFRRSVETHDVHGEHQRELLGRGGLKVAVTPNGADLFLFRYVPYSTLRAGRDVPRLVPVPTAGLGRTLDGEWSAIFLPGDPCLVIESTGPGSPAAAAGLEPGDLVLALGDQPLSESLYWQAEEGEPPRRISSVNGLEIRNRLDLYAAFDGQESVELLLAGETMPRLVERRDFETVSGLELAERGSTDAPLEFRCLRDGEIVDVPLRAGEPLGLDCRETVYPLICSEANRIRAGATIEAEPGSYLILARAAGFETQRFPVMVDRLSELTCDIRLLAEGSTPPGFVHIPSGPVRLGGDPRAIEPLPSHEETVESFFIQRHELTNADWNEFLADPEIAARMEASEDPIYIPRERSGPMPPENLGGPSAPVMGISWTDVRDFLEWRNGVAELRDEPWVYDLPSEVEWEKAARGADGRSFPWGSRFDYAATVGLYSRAIPLYDAPGGIELRDESPFGVIDAGGFRQEWTRDAYVPSPGAPPIYRWRGGSWRSTRPQDFRVASRGYGRATYVGGNAGVRLIARPR